MRLLNGIHTTLSPAAFVSGKNLVRDCVEDEQIHAFMYNTLKNEIAPVLTEFSEEEKDQYIKDLFDRFSNPFVDHMVTSIALNTTAKWKARVLPTVKEYVSMFGKAPKGLAAGFAGYVRFYHGDRFEDGLLAGDRNGEKYLINDDKAALDFFYENRALSEKELAVKVMKNTAFWDEDLTQIEGFAEAVLSALEGDLFS